MTATPERPRQPPVKSAVRRRARFAGPATEPSLGEILDDPIVRVLMARDGIGIGDIRHLAALIRGRCRCGGATSAADAPPAARGAV